MNNSYFKNLLHNRKLKATSPRLNLLETIQKYASAMPYSAIQKAMNPIDRVTLYRTLESLRAKGIIHKAFQEGQETYYAICGDNCFIDQHDHDHIHFKCKNCATVSCEKTNQSLKISLPEYEIHSFSVYVEGICKLCNANKSSV